MNKEQEQYIEHEVKLRVIKEISDDRFIQIEKERIEDRNSIEKSRKDDRAALQQSILTIEKVYDLQFTELRRAIKKTDNKLIFIISTLLTLVIIPIFMKVF